MGSKTWQSVDSYFESSFIRHSQHLADAIAATDAAGMPPIHVSQAQGRMLTLLASLMGAKRILEVGALGGYSTICLASALPEGGELITLEYSPKHAEVATRNIAKAGLADRVTVKVGAGMDLLPTLEGPFDLIFIDANKEDNPGYFEHALRLSRPGSLIIVDNVVRDGRIADMADTRDDVVGTRKMFDMVAAEARVEATAIQTVGSKGYDGFALIRVRA